MRPSPRIVSVLAGLALALGGIAIAAPAAHADMGDCTGYLQDRGFDVTDTARTACYYALVGQQSMCVDALTPLGIPGAVATEACRRAAA